MLFDNMLSAYNMVLSEKTLSDNIMTRADKIMLSDNMLLPVKKK
jgi:hypothetical protein